MKRKLKTLCRRGLWTKVTGQRPRQLISHSLKIRAMKLQTHNSFQQLLLEDDSDGAPGASRWP